MKIKIVATALLLFPNILFGAEVKRVEYSIESLFPIYFFEGYHLAVGIRINDFRLRASCIDGGNYDYEPDDDQFERNLGKGCGVFAGYFLDKRWHVYLFVEKQSYLVTKRDNGVSEEFDVLDIGPGLGYQYYFTENAYLQPALHLYWRKSEKKIIDGINYELREFDLSPTIRVGYRF
jgi:hypothetical protein